MTKTIKILALASLLLVSLAAFGQASLTQTTLGAAQNCGPACGASGVAANNLSLTVNLASATGITQSFNGQPVTFILVGQEVEGILTLVTGQTTIYNVLRGQMGTKESAHPSGDMVLAEVVTPQFGGYSGSGGFQQTDPPVNGNCTGTNTLATPWINVFTGAQWLCSSITNTWVPGWNNPYSGGPGGRASATATVASAATMTPSGPFFHVSGTTTMTTFGIPIGFNATAAGGGSFCYVNDGVASTTAGNNIGASVTAVANTMVCWTWDAGQSKFYPIQ